MGLKLGWINAKTLSALFILNLFFQRPAALGQNYTIYSLFFSIILVLFFLYIRKYKYGFYPYITKDMGFMFFMVFIYMFYESMVAIYFGEANLMSWLKEVIITAVIVLSYGIFLSDKKNNDIFFSQLTSIISILGWSSLLTLILSWFIGIEKLELLRIKIELYEEFGGDVSAGTVYFPLSMIYSSLKDFGLIKLYRFSGFFREAGIYQAVAAYCLVVAILSKRSSLVMAGLVAGIICAFSTAGLAMLTIAIGVAYIVRGGVSIKVAVAVAATGFIGWYVTLYAPMIGILYKYNDVYFNVSITERSDAFVRGVYSFMNNPFGYGPFSGDTANDQITLLSSLGAIGFAGFMIQVILLSGFRPGPAQHLKQRMAACLPILLTALFSQPIYALPFIYVLVMFSPRGTY